MRIGPFCEKLPSRLTLCTVALTFLQVACLRAQEPQIPDGPKPKIERRSFWHRLFPYDRFEWSMAVVQAAAELFDGAATHNYTHRDLARCQACTEGEPLARFFLGPRPTWPRMILFGTVEDWVPTYLDHRMRRSRHRLIRWVAPVPQFVLTSIHIKEGTRAADMPDDCTIGMVEFNGHCYIPGTVPPSVFSRK
jgi:hypothetical protein